MIGARRWDRDSAASAVAADVAQTPLDVTQPYWTTADERAPRRPERDHVPRPAHPGWFRLTFDGPLPTVCT